jgi:hypothetical protein
MGIKAEVRYLPETLRDISELIGLPATLKLVECYGGIAALYIPRMIKPDHHLARNIGIEAARKLAAHYGTDCLRNIPRCAHKLRHFRNAEIRTRRKAGESPAILARAYGMTERNVWMILAE